MANVSAGGNMKVGRDITITESGGDSKVNKEDQGQMVEQIRRQTDEIKKKLDEVGADGVGSMVSLAVEQALGGREQDTNPYVDGLKGVLGMAKAAREDLAPLLDQLFSWFSSK